MGMMTDAAIDAWQEKAGLKPATGSYALALQELSERAFELIKIIELEKSGIRDGDGYWHGSDVVGGTLNNMVRFCKFALKLSAGPNDAAKEFSDIVGKTATDVEWPF